MVTSLGRGSWERLLPVIETLLEGAGGMTEDVMSSYTHVQHAQPISVAYWLSHYAAVFLRDLDRLKRAYRERRLVAFQ